MCVAPRLMRQSFLHTCFVFLPLCSTTTSKLNVLVTKLHEYLAHTAVEDSDQTSPSENAEGTADDN